MDDSKYIAFADYKSFSWNHLLDPDRLKSYITHLQKIGIGTDGVLTKLDRVQTAIKYLMRDLVQYKNVVQREKLYWNDWRCGKHPLDQKKMPI